MKSKTSYFNRTLFSNLLKRYWPIFVGYFIIWLIILPIWLANMLKYSDMTLALSSDTRVYVADVGNHILRLGLYGGIIMSGIFAVLIAMAAFNYLYNARSVSMMCSLPIKREGVFLSVFTSGLVGMFAINIIVFLITLGVETAYGAFALGTAYLLQWLAMVCMMNLFFFGFAALCSSFTGHILVLPIVYIVLNFTAYVVEFLVKTIMSIFIYGINITDSFAFISFSPLIKLMTKTNTVSVTEQMGSGANKIIGYYYNGWTSLAVYAVVGILFALFAMLIIKHRRMETAGDVVSVRPLKPVFKYCLSIGCALVLGMGIYAIVFSNVNTLHGTEGMLFLLLFMIFGTFIGYFAAEMLMQKTLHVFAGHNWIGLGVTAVLITALMFCGEYDVFGCEKKLPDVTEVQSVSIICNGENVVFEQTENIEETIKLHGDIISHKDANEEYTGNYELDSHYVKIVYTYKNGKTLTRYYDIYTDASDDIYTLNDLLNVKEAVNYRKALDIPVSVYTITDAYISYFDLTEEMYKTVQLSSEQAYELHSECILPDIDDGTLGKVWLVADDDYYKNIYDCTINFSVHKLLSDNSFKSDYFYTTLTLNSVRTKQWIADNIGIEPCTMGESRDILNEAYPDKALVYNQ